MSVQARVRRSGRPDRQKRRDRTTPTAPVASATFAGRRLSAFALQPGRPSGNLAPIVWTPLLPAGDDGFYPPRARFNVDSQSRSMPFRFPTPSALLRSILAGRRAVILVGGALVVLVAVWQGPAVLRAWAIHQARSALRLGDTETAFACLQRVPPTARDDAAYQFLLGRVYRRRGEMAAAGKHLKRALDLGFPPRRIQREQWLAYAQAGEMREAEPHLSALLADPGEDGPEICEAFANGYYRNYQFARAFQILDAWQADFPDDPRPFVFRAVFHEHMMNWKDAEAAYREALKRSPGRSDWKLALAKVLIKLHRYDEANALFEEVAAVQPDAPDLLLGWAESLIEQGRYAEARPKLQRLLEVDPDHVWGRIQLGALELAAGNPQQAVAILEPVVHDRPWDVTARYNFASALRLVGRTEEAQRHMRFVAEGQKQLARVRSLMEKLAGDPRNVELRFQIGSILLKYDAPEDGAGWLKSVLNIDPNHLPTHRLLADYYSRTGRAALAEEHRKMLRKLQSADTPSVEQPASRGSARGA
ncbi:MAG: hypothetical protein D6725_14210 [Planctomycetota bacterium]|nr:MAG: hypothetical protein D6725_14210 [Planctomycetota bacterium]